MIIETAPIRFRRIIPESCSFGRVYVWLPKDWNPYVTHKVYPCSLANSSRGSGAAT